MSTVFHGLTTVGRFRGNHAHSDSEVVQTKGSIRGLRQLAAQDVLEKKLAAAFAKVGKLELEIMELKQTAVLTSGARVASAGLAEAAVALQMLFVWRQFLN